jgi:hypothetical protein
MWNHASNDTWVFDLSDESWSRIETLVEPSRRCEHGMANIYGTKRMVLFGGRDEDYNRYYETWQFSLYPYKNGTYISKAYNIGPDISFNSLNWDAATPPGTSIKFQIRTAEWKSVLDDKEFVGPDGTNNSYYEFSPSILWTGHNGDKWFQYKAYFNTNNFIKTPILHYITLYYNHWPVVELKSPVDKDTISNNKPLFEWDMIDNDSDQQSAYQVQIDDEDNFNSINYDSGSQVTTHKFWQFPSGTGYNTIPDGTWNWRVRLRDNDGDWGQYSLVSTFKVDTVPPTSSISTPDKLYNSELDNISGFAYDNLDGSGLNLVQISIVSQKNGYFWSGGIWTELETWLPADGTTDWTFNSKSVVLIPNMEYTVRSRAIDNAGNIEIKNEGITIVVETERPSSTLENFDDVFFINNNIRLDMIMGEATDNGGSGVERVELCINRVLDNNYWDGTHWISKLIWLEAKGEDHWFYDASIVTWHTDVEYIIYTRSFDFAGNEELPYNQHKFMFDDRSPENLSISIVGVEEYTNTTKVTLSLNAEDSGSGVFRMSFSFNNEHWSPWQPYYATTIYELNAKDGQVTLYFNVMDRAHNEAEPVYTTIILDMTPPMNPSISINNDAAKTDAPQVILKLNAYDVTSGVNEMAFSEDNITWTDWEPFMAIRYYTLSEGDGEKTIYFRVRDKVGNEAPPESASIIVDTTKPIDKPEDQSILTSPEQQSNLLTYIGIAVVIILILIVVLFIIKKLKNKEDETRDISREKDVRTTPMPDEEAVTPVPTYVPPGTSQTVTKVQKPPGGFGDGSDKPTLIFDATAIPTGPTPQEPVPVPRPTPVKEESELKQPQPTSVPRKDQGEMGNK